MVVACTTALVVPQPHSSPDTDTASSRLSGGPLSGRAQSTTSDSSRTTMTLGDSHDNRRAWCDAVSGSHPLLLVPGMNRALPQEVLLNDDSMV